MIKNLIAALLVGALSACGGGGGSDEAANTGDRTLTQGNETVRIDQAGLYNLAVPSSNNTVTIGAGNTLGTTGIAGANNALNVEDSVAMEILQVTGSNNSVSLGNTTTIAHLDARGDNVSVSIGAGSSVALLSLSGSNGTVTVQSGGAVVPDIRLSGSNIRVYLPAGYLAQTTITNTGVNNSVDGQ
jgi:hypothetical protein